MTERWLESSPDAEGKRQQNFESWLMAENFPFADGDAESKYKQRVRLLKDAIELEKVPERVPVCPSPGHFPIEYAGISWQEAMYDYDKLAAAWGKYYSDFNPDSFTGPRGIVPGPVLDILDYRLYQWAGRGLEADKEYQFVEKEYMFAHEYQDLIDDPTGFFLNVYFPRTFGTLDPLKSFPIIPPVHEIPMVPPAVMPFSSTAMKTALTELASAGDETSRWSDVMGQVSVKIMATGLPAFAGGLTKAPFDVIGDSLRGTRGIMLDMFRQPDELIEACERLTPFMVKYGVNGCKASGQMMLFIPLHKGADDFMSDEQFSKFYWPTLRKVVIGLIDEGLVPILFAEGGYNTRLELVDDLPKGKVIWHFDRTDIARAKATVGQTCCIAGNVPLDLLYTGTVDDVTAYCRELIDTAGRDGGFILNTGAGMQGAKPENIKAMIDFSLEYGVYR